MGAPVDIAHVEQFGPQVIIFDTTLRDGEQSPGISLDAREKVEIAEQLARLRVDVIEAGFPAASPGDFDAVKAVAEIVGNDATHRTPPVIAALARCVEADIEAAGKALAPAARSRIHVFISSSDIQRTVMLRASREEVLRDAVRGVELARAYTDDVEFSPQDATRTDFEFLVELCTAAVEAGATTINIPDTVGYALPHDFGRMIRQLHERIPQIRERGVVLSVHCHNDLGLAVANSLEAIRNGARQVEVAVNGIGERAGNCSLEEVVMAIRVRQDLLGVDHGIYTPELMRTSRLVSRLTGYSVQRNKAVVGANAFAHESGIHQHGVLQDRQTYEIMRAEDIGAQGAVIVLGKHSGRHAFRKVVTDLGFDLSDEEFEAAFRRFKELADRKGEVSTADVEAIVLSETHVRSDDAFELVGLEVSAATGRPPRARVEVRIIADGRTVTAEATGDGMVDAACRAIRDAIGLDGVRLVQFDVSAVTEGVDALGDVTVVVEAPDGARYTGRGVSTDIVEASARAYLDALNRVRRIEPRPAEYRP